MAVPATSTLLDIYDNEDAEMDILITGYQWKWKYEYLNEDGENVSFFSNLRTSQSEIYNTEDKGEHYLLEVDEPLVLARRHQGALPDHCQRRDPLLVGAGTGGQERRHSRLHQRGLDAARREPGIYRGQCAELCGKDHGFMPIVVNVVSKEEYNEWLGTKQAEAAEIKQLMAQTFTMDELMERGKAVYDRNCLACHGANGEGGVGTAIAGSPIATGRTGGHLDSGHQRRARHRDAGLRRPAQRCRHGGGHHLPAQCVRQQHGRHGSAH